MKVFFDNNVPVPLRNYLSGCEVTTARQMGWHELANGQLLAAAEEAGFPVMITGDKNLSYQQNLKGRKIALVVLSTTRWQTLKHHAAPVLAALRRAGPGTFEQLPDLLS